MYQKATIINKILTSPNTEYSQALPDNCKKMQIACRGGGSDIKCAFVSTQSGTLYFTVLAGSVYSIDNIYFEPGSTIYMQSTDPSVTAEILAFA